MAASAPILQFEGMVKCKSFYRILSSDFKMANEECEKSIRHSWDAINNTTSTDGGKAWLSSSWKLCKPLTKSDDVQKLKDWLVNIYTNFGMLDYPYPTNFLTPLPANPIVEMCQFLNDSTVPEKKLLEGVFKAVTVYFNFTGTASCLNVDDQAGPNLGVDGWDYQACTEMVMPMCSDGEKDMFEPQKWDLVKYVKDCKSKFWGVEPQPQLVPLRYGGLDLASASSNIIFSNGLRDPWAGGGVLRNLSDSVVSVVIPEGAHHLDLRGSHPNDPFSVVMARNFYRDTFVKWISSFFEI
ncbi:hypothetical protein B566_EDAN014759 [Ephemera danica]|nr:hypothetical protein B566_EDAN014759 [Ephemera danica]